MLPFPQMARTLRRRVRTQAKARPKPRIRIKNQTNRSLATLPRSAISALRRNRPWPTPICSGNWTSGRTTLKSVVPLCATVIVAGGAKAKHNRADPTAPPIAPSSGAVDLHAALGASTAVLYGFTAYYAIAAPRIPGVKPKGAIRLHRDLVWIHAPGMILTPILGGMALSQENNGEKVHGVAAAHSYVAWTTVGAYGASIVAVSWPLHLKFWEKR